MMAKSKPPAITDKGPKSRRTGLQSRWCGGLERFKDLGTVLDGTDNKKMRRQTTKVKKMLEKP